MEFTKEAWENAPEGATLEYRYISTDLIWSPAYLVGFTREAIPVVECRNNEVYAVDLDRLRIILPKRKVTVQLWRMVSGQLATSYVNEERWAAGAGWTLLGEHTFEIEGE